SSTPTGASSTTAAPIASVELACVDPNRSYNVRTIDYHDTHRLRYVRMRLDSALVQSVVTATLAALLASCGTFSPEPPSVQSLRTDPASRVLPKLPERLGLGGGE